MTLDGPSRRRLREIFLQSFDRRDLRIALLESEGHRTFEDLVPEAGFSDQLAVLIEKAENEGWLDELGTLFETQRGANRPELLAEIQEILGRAKDGAHAQDSEPANSTPDDPPKTGLAPGARLLRFTLLSLSLGVLNLAVALGVREVWKSGALWALILAGVSLTIGVVLAIHGFLHRREPVPLLRSGIPKAVFGLLIATLLANCVLLTIGIVDQDPNFMIRVTDADRPVARQTVFLAHATANGTSKRNDRTTNANGEAFFRLVLDLDRYYLGGVEILSSDQPPRLCEFPSFWTPREGRSITHDLDDLHCAETRVAETLGTGLRVDHNAKTALPTTTNFTVPETLAESTDGIGGAFTDMARDIRNQARTSLDERRQRAPLGLPDAPLILDRLYYTLGYDPELRAPRWVAYTIDARNATTVPRKPTRWVLDPDIHPDQQSDPEDYNDNPYDRGTLVRRIDLGALGEQALIALAEAEIFYYSVIVPQPAKTNQITWLQVEDFATQTSQNLGPIHIIAGPVYPREQGENHPFLVIGPGRTIVPIALYRILLRPSDDGWHALAFLVPNDGSVSKDPLDFLTSVDKIEDLTGLDFFPEAPEGEQRGLEEDVELGAFTEANEESLRELRRRG